MKIDNEINILMGSETKLDDILPTSQFFVQGYSILFKMERTLNEGPIFFNIRVEISLAKQLKLKLIPIMKAF